MRWRRCDTLLDEILKARFSDGVTIETPGGELLRVTESGLFTMFGSADMAVLDDIGTARLNEERYPAFMRLIDSRCDKPTIYTSNKGPQELEEIYDERIISRLTAGLVIPVSGLDRRQDKSAVKVVKA